MPTPTKDGEGAGGEGGAPGEAVLGVEESVALFLLARQFLVLPTHRLRMGLGFRRRSGHCLAILPLFLARALVTNLA